MLFSKHVCGSRWAMHSSELLPLLGLKAGGHLPAEGLSERTIEGVTVYVLPATQTDRKSSKHRVMAVCPECGRHMSAGRLASQHYKTAHKQALAVTDHNIYTSRHASED